MTELRKAAGATAGEVLAGATLSDEARALLGRGEQAPGAFLDTLLAAGALPDAITLLAHALPPREGVWWACRAARTLPLGDEAALPRRCVRAAEAWVFEPTEDKRHAAMELAEALEFEGPASQAALAAFWSGESIAPRDQAPVPPPPGIAGKAVAGAVLLAAVTSGAGDPSPRQRALIEAGIDIANGGAGRGPGEAEG